MEYSNKTILITGASSGIGAATALKLAPFNNRIIITARRKENKVNIFPPATEYAAKLGKMIPDSILTKVLLSQTPADY